tara:strand:- start:414 stop:614 length:201 start_codon:yes stop_codon:yes gene_type:complete
MTTSQTHTRCPISSYDIPVHAVQHVSGSLYSWEEGNLQVQLRVTKNGAFIESFSYKEDEPAAAALN